MSDIYVLQGFMFTLSDDFYCRFLCWSYCFGHWSYWFHGQSIIREVAAVVPNNNKNLCTNSTKKRILCGNEINPVARVQGNSASIFSYIFKVCFNKVFHHIQNYFGIVGFLVSV